MQLPSEIEEFIVGWQLSVALNRTTPLRWVRRHNEFREGVKCPAEPVPARYGVWVPVAMSWRALGIDRLDVPGTMASEIGDVPQDGGDWLSFLLEYRMIVEGSGSLDDLASRYPHWAHLAKPLAPRATSRE